MEGEETQVQDLEWRRVRGNMTDEKLAAVLVMEIEKQNRPGKSSKV